MRLFLSILNNTAHIQYIPFSLVQPSVTLRQQVTWLKSYYSETKTLPVHSIHLSYIYICCLLFTVWILGLWAANTASVGGHMLPMWNAEMSKRTMISACPLPPKCSFILPKTSLRGGSSMRWHQQSINEGNSEEEALGSSYTANNVTDQTVWIVGLRGSSSGEIIMTGLIQQEEDRSMDRKSQGGSHVR